MEGDFSNPLAPPDDDGVGASTLDEDRVIALITALVEPPERGAQTPSTSQEESGSLLWDLAASAENAPCLVNSLLPEALATLLMNPSTHDRVREIALGTLGNLLCAPDGWLRLGNDEIVANAAARSLFDSTHAPVILEACRCFAVAARPNGNARAWRAVALGDDAFAGRVLLVAASTARADVLTGALNCLASLCSVGTPVDPPIGTPSRSHSPSPASTPRRSAAAATTRGVSSAVGAVYRAGGVDLISSLLDPRSSEATPEVVDAALRLLEALATAAEIVADAWGEEADSAAAAEDILDATRAKETACSHYRLRVNVIDRLARGHGGGGWADDANDGYLEPSLIVALAQLAAECADGPGAVARAIACRLEALDVLVAAARGSDEETEAAEAAAYLLRALCAVLDGRVALDVPLPSATQNAAVARLEAAKLP
jgi:hypothetical protein